MLAKLLIGNVIFFGILALYFFFVSLTWEDQKELLEKAYIFEKKHNLMSEEKYYNELKKHKRKTIFYFLCFTICLIISINCITIGINLK